MQEAARFLHSIGVIIHSKFSFAITDLVILSPSWLNESLLAFFEVARIHATFGILKYEKLQQFLETFPEQFREPISHMLEKLEVSYALPDTNASLFAKITGSKSWFEFHLDLELSSIDIFDLCYLGTRH